MTFTVVGRTTHTEAGTNIGIDIPSGVENGDLAVAQIVFTFAGANLTVNWVNGWTRLRWDRASVSTGNSVLYVCKWLNGDEDGVTYLESKDSGGSITACTVLRGVDRNQGFLVEAATSTSTNPNPPSLTVPWTEDTFWLASVGADNAIAGAITGGDSDYTAGVNAGGNGFIVATKERQINTTTQDPTSWTRLSEQWSAETAGFPPVQTINYPSILRAEHFYASDAVSHDYTLTIPDGTNRAMFVWVNSNITTLSLDPSGLNLELSYAQDAGATQAKQPSDTGASCGSWSTLDPALIPAPGSYTLRINPTGTTAAQIFVVFLQNATQELEVKSVGSVIHAIAEQNHDIDLTVPDKGGIFLMAATRQFAGGFISGGAYVYINNSDPTLCCNSDGVRMVAEKEIHNNVSRHSALFLRGYGSGRANDLITNRVRSSFASTGSVLGISVGFKSPANANAPFFAAIA